ncbi:poly(U)-specific endoribonuclease-A-like [Pomacea canaliculata]|uniref:poly(U)-specific endoribonuclease-A-like n=1 Tax=Pomacea canaliculata TaxID=400727 RepID=UPI000D73F9C6|nr:poly(U)-specific endoribonuclease-A-like [Pomacea canaliculata]
MAGYYLKERSESINYHGYVRTAEPNIIAVDYDWRGRHKSMGLSSWVPSPEFDMALYSLSGLTNTSQVLLDGHTVHLQFYDLERVNGLQVASAYPII